METVVVVGAGPTGLALACGLRAAGISVRVLDGAAGPAVTSRALGLQPRGVEVLDRLGALGELPDRGLAIRSVVITVNGRELARLRVGQSMQRLGGRTALLMSQADIEAALRDRLAALGGSVEWDRGVADVIAGADGVELRLGNGDEVRAGWVIGADGAHSVVRKAMHVGFPGVRLIEHFLLADVHADIDRPRDNTYGWLRGTQMLVAFPLPGVDLWRLMTPAPPGCPADPGQDEIVGYLGERLAAEARGSINSVEWTSSFRIHRRITDTYRRGRMMLAGDAAHIHSPLGGQGMNTGIGDAENLGMETRVGHFWSGGCRPPRHLRGRATPDRQGRADVDQRRHRTRGWPRPDLPARARPHCPPVDEPRLGSTPDRGKGVTA